MSNKIAGFSFVKNECDIIEKFVKHNLVVFDEFTIIDNGSTDGTLEILKKFSKSIKLVEDKSSFGHKGRICSTWMSRSDADLLVPLDADEFLILDDGKEVVPDPILVKNYLKEIEVRENNIFQIKNTYLKHPDDNEWWGVHRSNKRFMARSGFVAIDDGFHGGHMKKNENAIQSNISHLHYHFRSKDAWLKSTEQKLKARLGDKWDDLDFLETYRGASFHVGRELCSYKKTGIWHSVKKQFQNKNLSNY